jgi:hypothetical protein
MDLSKLSTPDLKALRDGDLSRMSTDGLLYLKQATAQPQEQPKAEPGIAATIGRQIGLTARHGIEGLAELGGVVYDPIAATINQFGTQIPTLGSRGKQAADAIGLPKPESAQERIAGEGAKLIAPAGGMLKIAQKAEKLPGLIGKAGQFFAQQPTAQLTAAAGGGMAGEAAKETGQNSWWQAAASVGGSLAGGMTPGVINRGVSAVKSAMPAAQQQIDVQLTSILGDAGIDFPKMPNAFKEQMRSDMRKALNTDGPLNADAVRRLAQIRMVGGTPTLGMVTLDPVQITKEKNLAKIAANSGDESMHGLPRMENENNKALTAFADKIAGGNADLYTAGERSIGAIRGRDASAKAVEGALYRKAQEAGGRDIQLSRADFVDDALTNLAKSNKGAFLPPTVEAMLNEISLGQVTKLGKTFDVPFDVNTIDALKTILAQESRNTSNGNTKAAIKAVRDALENIRIEPVKSNFGGSSAATQQMGQAMQQADQLPAEALKAFDKARAFARARRTWQESSKPVEAALDGAEPDKFVERYFLRGTVADAKGMSSILRKSPEAMEATKQAIVNHLKSKALSGADAEVGGFSQKAFNDALSPLSMKLPLLFSPQEIAQLKALGKAASYMQVQPPGSAVNNSNSGALVMGKAGDALEGLLKVIPFGFGTGMADLSKRTRIKLTTRQVKNIPQGLVAPQPKEIAYSRGALPLSIYGGGLLGAPGID